MKGPRKFYLFFSALIPSCNFCFIILIIFLTYGSSLPFVSNKLHKFPYACVLMVLPLIECFLELYRTVVERNSPTWQIFSFKELIEATDNFYYNKKLGEGGFGTVYLVLSQDLYLCKALHKIPILCNNWKFLPLSPK
jgi:hypothetical protein